MLGGAIANNILNARKSHPDHPSRPVIDWDLILQLEPMTMAGALVGADLNDLLPDVVLVVMLFLLLSMTAHKTLQKAIKLHNEENRKIDQERISLMNGTPSQEYGTTTTNSSATSDVNPKVVLNNQPSFGEDMRSQARVDALKLTALFIVLTILNLLKGGIGEGGPLPVDLKSCGPTCFWLFEGLMLLLLLLFAVHVRSNILHRAESGGPLISEIEWNSKNTISYPLLSICAGLVAGLFGVGGGIVKGPLMLALGKRSGF